MARRTRMRGAGVLAIATLTLLLGGCGSSNHSGTRPSRSALQNLSWVGTTDGWALAAKPCKRGSCARLLRTTDGAHHWQALPDPPAHIADSTFDCQHGACVSAVSFATPSIGYLYGPALLMTTDGGRSWHTQRGLQLETLSVAGDSAYRVAYHHMGCPGPCQPLLQMAPVGSAKWRTLVRNLVAPDRNGTAQIVASGPTLLLALYGSQAAGVSAHATVYRSTNRGASWQWSGDPCSGRGPHNRGEEDLIAVTVAPGGLFAGLCTAHAGIPGGFVVTSTDSGASWHTSDVLPRVHYPALIAAASAKTLAVATGPTGGSGPFTDELILSTDAGHHWHLAAVDHQRLTDSNAPAWLGFQTATVGRWIGDPHSLWTSRDAGAHWTRRATPQVG